MGPWLLLSFPLLWIVSVKRLQAAVQRFRTLSSRVVINVNRCHSYDRSVILVCLCVRRYTSSSSWFRVESSASDYCKSHAADYCWGPLSLARTSWVAWSLLRTTEPGPPSWVACVDGHEGVVTAVLWSRDQGLSRLEGPRSLETRETLSSFHQGFGLGLESWVAKSHSQQDAADFT